MKMILKQTKTIVFEKGFVDITDPCYEKDTWCRLNNVKIKKGEYFCHNYVAQGRTFMMEIMNKEFFGQSCSREEIDSKYEDIGSVGVDAGMCGIFEDKPDYTFDEWKEWCTLDKTKSPNGGKILVNADTYKCIGVCCCSGYGDGEYFVSGIKNDNDEYVAIKIDF